MSEAIKMADGRYVESRDIEPVGDDSVDASHGTMTFVSRSNPNAELPGHSEWRRHLRVKHAIESHRKGYRGPVKFWNPWAIYDEANGFAALEYPSHASAPGGNMRINDEDITMVDGGGTRREFHNGERI